MRQKYGKAAAVYNIVIHINGDIGALITGAISDGVTVDANDIGQQINGKVGMVAGRNITSKGVPLQALVRRVARELERQGED